MSLSTSSLISSDTSDRVSYEESYDAEIQQYMRQTRLWRVANSAQWVAWGIVQAKIAAMEEEEAAAAKALASTAAAAANKTTAAAAQPLESVVEEAEESEFDYLAYAQDRALFFWADVLAMGLIRENELPAEILKAVRKRMLSY